MKINLSGTGVALVTPFNPDYSIDYDGLKVLLDSIYESRVNYVVVNGTTGESPTLSWVEKISVLEYVLNHNPKKLPILFGHGGSDTQFLVEKFADLKSFPISGILSVSPYYNRPTQEGIRLHYEYIADRSPFPIILYNVPSRTSSNIDPATTAFLSHHQNILGIKEANTNPEQWATLCKIQSDDFSILCGDDLTAPLYLQTCARGVISVAANIIPQLYAQMVNDFLTNKSKSGLLIYKEIYPILKLIIAQGNPVSVKTALSANKIIGSTVRMPLISGSLQFEEEALKVLNQIKKGAN